MEHNFTCISCQLAFLNPDIQRDHYKGELHRYNLMRKVAQMPPVTQAEFAARADAQQAAGQSLAKVGGFSCGPCRKQFASEGAHQSHMTSRKHKDVVSSVATASAAAGGAKTAATSARTAGEAASTRAVADDHKYDLRKARTEAEAMAILDARIANAPRLAATDCLFCAERAGSVEANLAHMVQTHSFFIPDHESLADLPGLLKYLGEKISVGNLCLTCNGKGKAFHSMESVRKHMCEKGHCRVAWDEEDEQAEIDEFYDFGALASEAELSDDDDDASWEDLGSDGESEVAAAGARSSRGRRAFVNDRLELELPGGGVAAHRALLKFYRKEVRTQLPEEHPIQINRAMHQQIAYHPAAQTMARTAERQKNRVQQYRALTYGMKNNNQKHFRDQMLQ